MFDPGKFSHAQPEDIRKILFAKPKTAWAGPKNSLQGVTLDLHSTFELENAGNAFPKHFASFIKNAPQRLERQTRIHTAGEFSRTEEVRTDDKLRVFALENPTLGAVYIDVVDHSYIHFAPNQLQQAGLPVSLKELKPTWQLSKAKDTLIISLRSAVSLDLVLKYSGQQDSRDIASIILRTCLPGIDDLIELGLPFQEIVVAGTPASIETWVVNPKGVRVAMLARHQVTKIITGMLDPALFQIPKDFRDLRRKNPDDRRSWHPLGGKHPRRKPPAKATQTEQASALQVTQSGEGEYVVRGPLGEAYKVKLEPNLPECLPSTRLASSALEIRQQLLDVIQFLVNLIANRLDTVTGGRVDANDPDNTDVELTIDWLDQLEQFSQNRQGDGVFCLLREPPPADDPLGGGTGLLDRRAESMARRFASADPPFPFGGEDEPISLPSGIQAELEDLAEDDSIEADERFDNLSAASRAAIREAVLAQRIGRIKYPFEGDFGEHIWPNRDFELVHIKLQLEQLSVEFSDDDTIRELIIAVGSSSDEPRIDFKLALEKLDATLTMERWPGFWFWWTAAGVLVAAGIVGTLAVGALILTLMGMGPLGLLVLAALISQAPAAAVASVLGGALVVAAVTYLVWDTTQLRLVIDQPVLSSSVKPVQAEEPDEVVLHANHAKLDGDITVSVNSEIPSGIHQIFDFIANNAVTHFDTDIREAIEAQTVSGLNETIHNLSHFCLPPPFDTRVRLEITGAPIDHYDLEIPQHNLVWMRTNGVSAQLLSAGARTKMNFPFQDFQPLTTQVDPDLRERLSNRIEELRVGGRRPLLGYGISQNLLNGIVFSQWLAGQFQVHYSENQTNRIFETLTDILPGAADIADRDIHLWAATPPQLLVTPWAYLQYKFKPYLSVFFPDVRLCISGVFEKPSILEVQFSITSVAHVAFGAASEDDTRTLFSAERDFLRVLLDSGDDFRMLSPVDTQGFAVQGPGFDSIAAMDDTQQLLLLEQLQPLLDDACVRLLNRTTSASLSFVPESLRVDQQLYDGVVLADIHPHRSSLYVVMSINGPILQVLPSRDEEDGPNVDLDGMGCADGRFLRGI
ncbi:MAG TPA: phage holin family protein [Pyrinomonadaceae bacterium]|nr:phage holin family protein [Pyrinomonadaceae bacterium]